MTWIKICGITNVDDALAAADAGVNALGFVFYPKSPRYVTVETAHLIAAKVPKQIEKVGVFVNETVDAVREAVKQVGLTAVQLHGDESIEFSRTLFEKLANGSRRPTIFRTWPAKVFDVPAGQSVGWDPVAVGLVEKDEAYKGKRVHKIHVAENGDLFLETHGFRPGIVSGVLLDSSTAEKRGGTALAGGCNLNRDPIRLVRDAGFDVREARNEKFPPSFWLLGSHYSGVASTPLTAT